MLGKKILTVRGKIIGNKLLALPYNHEFRLTKAYKNCQGFFNIKQNPYGNWDLLKYVKY